MYYIIEIVFFLFKKKFLDVFERNIDVIYQFRLIKQLKCDNELNF